MSDIDVRIAKPCPQSWHSMEGDERARFCGVCRKNVFNIAEMTTAEVEELIRRTNGRFCARLYRRADGRVMTKDCSKGLARYRRKGAFALLRVGVAMSFGVTLTGCMGSTGSGPDAGDAIGTPPSEGPSIGKIADIPNRKPAEPTGRTEPSTPHPRGEQHDAH